MMDNLTLIEVLSLFSNLKAKLNLGWAAKRTGSKLGVALNDVGFDVTAALRLLLKRFQPPASLLKQLGKCALHLALLALVSAIVRAYIKKRAYPNALATARDPTLVDSTTRYVEGQEGLTDRMRISVAREALQVYEGRRERAQVRRTLIDYQDDLVDAMGRGGLNLRDFALKVIPTLGDFRALDPGSLRMLLLRLLHGYHDVNRDLRPYLEQHRAVVLDYTGGTFVQLSERFSPEPTVVSGCRVYVCAIHLWVSRHCGAFATQLLAAAVELCAPLQAV